MSFLTTPNVKGSHIMTEKPKPKLGPQRNIRRTNYQARKILVRFCELFTLIFVYNSVKSLKVRKTAKVQV